MESEVGWRAVATIRAYSQSFASKELELRREKHKTEALLHEMLPRSELCSGYLSTSSRYTSPDIGYTI